jgi:hypothetical protein
MKFNTGLMSFVTVFLYSPTATCELGVATRATPTYASLQTTHPTRHDLNYGHALQT